MTADAEKPSATSEQRWGIGQSLLRTEDRRLTTGKACFVDDNQLHNMGALVIVRSPYPHATFDTIDTSFAVDMPGVLAILTGEDYRRDGLGDIPCTSIGPEVMGGNWARTPFPALTQNRALCVGHALAVVVAETRNQAMDAAEAILVDYTPLPAVTGVDAALQEGAPQVWPEIPGNLCFVHELGNRDKTDQAFQRAAHVLSRRVMNQRIAGSPLEPRSYIGDFDAGGQRYHLTTCTQSPHRVQALLAEHIFKVPTHEIHVRCKDVGGGFGTKGNLYPEEILVLWAARKVGRPVKWLSDRNESFLSDFNGRDQVADAELALDEDGKILGFRATTITNLGCQIGPSGGHPPLIGATMLSGPYAIPAMHVTVQGVLTHTMTLTTYRGAGRPEATYLLERMIDMAAKEFDFDPVEIRRKNFIRPEQMPYETAVGQSYDCGEFNEVLDKAVAAADWSGFENRRQQSKSNGLLRGRGVSFYIEVCAVLGERMEIRFDSSGRITVVAGTCSSGQGHETVYPQMLADWLGVAAKDVRVLQGDTDAVAYGRGTYASRSMAVGGSALKLASDQIIRKCIKIAAHMWQINVENVAFADGYFRSAGTGEKIGLHDIARETYKAQAFRKLPDEFGTGLEAVGYYSASEQNFPNGCHIAEVEVDADTGVVKLDRFTAVDEAGVVINPLLFHGQTMGGIAQGVGQALFEEVVYDADGQLVTGGFTDYTMPRATDFPTMNLRDHCVPTKTNLLGVKGGGEGGTVGAAPAVINAVVDALQEFGITDIDMPATPLKVWQAIAAAQIQQHE